MTLWLLWHFVWIVTRLTAQCCLIALANKTSCENFNEWRRHRQGHCHFPPSHRPPTKIRIPRTNWRSVGAQFQWTLINRPLDTDADAGYTACHGYARRVQHKHTEIQNPYPFLSPPPHTHTHPIQLNMVGWTSYFGWTPHAVSAKMLTLIFRSAIVSLLRLGFRLGHNLLWLCKIFCHFPLLYPTTLLISPRIVSIFRYLSIICNWNRPKNVDFNWRQKQWLRL